MDHVYEILNLEAYTQFNVVKRLEGELKPEFIQTNGRRPVRIAEISSTNFKTPVKTVSSVAKRPSHQKSKIPSVASSPNSAYGSPQSTRKSLSQVEDETQIRSKEKAPSKIPEFGVSLSASGVLEAEKQLQPQPEPPVTGDNSENIAADNSNVFCKQLEVGDVIYDECLSDGDFASTKEDNDVFSDLFLTFKGIETLRSTMKLNLDKGTRSLTYKRKSIDDSSSARNIEFLEEELGKINSPLKSSSGVTTRGDPQGHERQATRPQSDEQEMLHSVASKEVELATVERALSLADKELEGGQARSPPADERVGRAEQARESDEVPAGLGEEPSKLVEKPEEPNEHPGEPVRQLQGEEGDDFDRSQSILFNTAEFRQLLNPCATDFELTLTETQALEQTINDLMAQKQLLQRTIELDREAIDRAIEEKYGDLLYPSALCAGGGDGGDGGDKGDENYDGDDEDDFDTSNEGRSSDNGLNSCQVIGAGNCDNESIASNNAPEAGGSCGEAAGTSFKRRDAQQCSAPQSHENSCLGAAPADGVETGADARGEQRGIEEAGNASVAPQTLHQSGNRPQEKPHSGDLFNFMINPVLRDEMARDQNKLATLQEKFKRSKSSSIYYAREIWGDHSKGLFRNPEVIGHKIFKFSKISRLASAAKCLPK